MGGERFARDWILRQSVMIILSLRCFIAGNPNLRPNLHQLCKAEDYWYSPNAEKKPKTVDYSPKDSEQYLSEDLRVPQVRIHYLRAISSLPAQKHMNNRRSRFSSAAD